MQNSELIEFKISIQEIVTKECFVTAISKEEALKMVEDRYNQNPIFLGDGEVESAKFELIY